VSATSIEWTDRVWNPTRGCSRVSLGCGGPGRVGGCYAERQAHRFNYPGGPYEGLTRMTENGPRWTGVVRLVTEALDEPLHWKKSQRVFVNSMSDLFHESLPAEAIDLVYAVMILNPRHVFQILTKRPERMLAYLSAEDRRDRWHSALGRIGSRELGAYAQRFVQENGWPALDPEIGGDPLDHIWQGVSVEDQETADERIPLLLETPAAVRFVSLEPQLGIVCLCPYLKVGARLDWVIQGGESGPGARPFMRQWAEQTRDECASDKVAYFMKQMGRWVLGDGAGFEVNHYLLKDGRDFVPPMIGERAFTRPPDAIGFSLNDPKGGDMAAWPEDLRVRQFPEARA